MSEKILFINQNKTKNKCYGDICDVVGKKISFIKEI